MRAEPEGEFLPNTLIIMYDEAVGKDIRDAIAFFKKVKGVTSVERDRIIRLTDPVKPRLRVM